MNQAQRRKYSNGNHRIQVKIERKYMPLVFAELKKFFDHYAEVLRLRGAEAVRAKLNQLLYDTSIGDVIKKLYVEAGLIYAHRTYNEVLDSTREVAKADGNINFNDEWVKRILEYFKMYLIDKAVAPITLQSKNIIMAVLDRGTREGWSIERMAKELETDQLQMWRARLIVRTETAKAAFYGRRLGSIDSGFETVKEWISAHDNRVRHSHSDVDGETIDFSARFAVPIYKGNQRIGTEMMDGPGDPSASAANVCNCRCTTAETAKRDANGRLIRKPSSHVSVIQPNDFPNRPITTITV